jgi:hypothetical protein
MLLCKFYTQFRRKTREGEKERVFIRCFSIKNYTTVLFFLFFFLFFFFARTFIFHYISIVILYVFLSLFLVLMFFHFSFCPLFFLFVLFFLSIYINQFRKKTRERVSIHCFSMKNYTKLFSFFLYFSNNNYFLFSNRCFSMKNYITVFFFLLE